MSQIKSSNTKPETILKQFLKDLKIPFKSNYKHLPGTPDLYIPDLELIIQINGCFWHGHNGCKYFVVPKTNKSFWLKKIDTNISRDKRVNTQLKNYYSLRICTIWECEIKNGSYLSKLLRFL